jgi:hypothetical protein
MAWAVRLEMPPDPIDGTKQAKPITAPGDGNGALISSCRACACHEILALRRAQPPVKGDQLREILIGGVEIRSRLFQHVCELAHNLERWLVPLPLVLIDARTCNGGINPCPDAELLLRQTRRDARLLQAFRNRVACCVSLGQGCVCCK